MSRVGSSVAAGAAAGLAAGLAFATAHAFIITPVWNRMIGGLVLGVVAGAAAGWSYGELRPRDAPSTLRSGLAFGLLLWLAVVPVTLAWLRGRAVRAMTACALAAVFVTFAMGGPVPVGRGVRAVEILFGVLAASLVGGAVVGMLAPRLERQAAVDATASPPPATR